MVRTKALSLRILVLATIISMLLISVSIYLRVQQKHHLGRMNITDRRVKPTESVENHSKNDVIHIAPSQIIPSNSSATKSNKFISKSHSDFEDKQNDEYIPQGVQYPNNATSTMQLREDKSKDHKVVPKSYTATYLIDTDYSTDIDIEYLNPRSGDDHINSTDKLGLTQPCMHCLCMTVNSCEPYKCSHNHSCGIYGISEYYWLDGNSPTSTVENNNDYGQENQTLIDYLRCVNNDNCAAETVRNYIKRYHRDCNNDGVIDCQDHITLHLLGPSGCHHKQLSAIRRIRMKACLK